MEPGSTEAGLRRCAAVLAEGDIAITGLEMTRDSTRLPWTLDDADSRPRAIVENIHARRAQHSQDEAYITNVKGTKIAGALLAYGILEAHRGRLSRRWSLS